MSTSAPRRCRRRTILVSDARYKYIYIYVLNASYIVSPNKQHEQVHPSDNNVIQSTTTCSPTPPAKQTDEDPLQAIYRSSKKRSRGGSFDDGRRKRRQRQGWEPSFGWRRAEVLFGTGYVDEVSAERSGPYIFFCLPRQRPSLWAAIGVLFPRSWLEPFLINHEVRPCLAGCYIQNRR